MKKIILSAIMLGIGFTLAAAPATTEDKTIPPPVQKNPFADVVNPAPPATHDKQKSSGNMKPVPKRVNVEQKTPPATGKTLKPVPQKVKVPKPQKVHTNK